MRARDPRARRLLALAIVIGPLATAACGWSPSKPFEREAPPVKEAIGALDAGDAGAAAATLEEYLSTGACAEGSIGLPDAVRHKPNGAFDLGLALFGIGEAYGGRFGDEEADAGTDEMHQKRAANVACALSVVKHVASDEAAGIDLRARARYLEGNLDFLSGDYQTAVTAYDEAIRMAPGMVDAGDPVGRDAAWNRAIALRRIEDEKDAGNDAAPNPEAGPRDAAPPDGGGDGGGHGDSGSNGDSGSGEKDASSPQSPDAGGDGEKDAAPPSAPDAGPPPPQPKDSQDERMLDQLENAPTVQQEEAKRRAQQRRRVRGAEDK